MNLAVEIGCGWGFSLASLRKNFPAAGTLCGFDFNPAILVLARRMLQDMGLANISLAVANVENPLPFAKASVDFLMANSVVEHIGRQHDGMKSISQAMSRHSLFWFCVPNRYTLHPEPHFNVRFSGFFPRNLQTAYLAAMLRLPRKQVEWIWQYDSQDLANLLCPNFPNDVLINVPVCAPAPNKPLRLLAKYKPEWEVVSQECVVFRVPGWANKDLPAGVLHQAAPFRGGQATIVKQLAPMDVTAKKAA